LHAKIGQLALENDFCPARSPSRHAEREAPLLLASILFVWLVVGGALINRFVPALLG
jgi:hypothetical protein